MTGYLFSLLASIWCQNQRCETSVLDTSHTYHFFIRWIAVGFQHLFQITHLYDFFIGLHLEGMFSDRFRTPQLVAKMFKISATSAIHARNILVFRSKSQYGLIYRPKWQLIHVRTQDSFQLFDVLKLWLKPLRVT